MKSRLGLPADRSGRALAALLLAAILVLPFLFSRRGIDQNLGPKTLGLAALVAVLAIRRALRPTSGPASSLRHPVIRLAFAYAAWSMVATATALNVPEAAYDTAKTLLMAALLFEAAEAMAGAGPARGRAMLARAVVTFILAASLLGWGEACIRLKGGFSLEAIYRISGTFGHKNLFSSVLGVCLPVALFGLARFRGPWRVLAGIALALGGGLILLLQTRSVWLGGAFAFAVCAIAWAARVRPRMATLGRLDQGRRRIAAGAAVLMLAAALGAALIPALGMRERILAAADPEKNHWRLLLWAKSWDLALENPLTGVGPGNWKIAIPKHDLEVVRVAGGDKPGEETGMVRPHNDYLWVLCETGFPGLFLYCAFFAATVIACWRKSRAHAGTEQADYALCLLGSLAIYSVDAVFSFPRERIEHGAFLAIFIAALIASRPEPDVPDARPLRRYAQASKWLYLLVSCAWLPGAWIRWEAEREVRQALDARSSEKWDQVVARLKPWVARAYPLDGYGNPCMFYAGTAYTLSGDLDRALEAFSEAAKAHPFHAHTLNDLGTCMAMKRNPEQAIPYFERAVAVRPGLSDAWLNGAIVLYGMREWEKARFWLAHVPEASQDPRRARLQALLKEVP